VTPAKIRAPVTPRAGLGEAPRRLSEGPGTVAYCGASVTVQREGYRPRLQAALCTRFGHEHQGITAAVGGVGSISQVFFVEDLAIPRDPVLCFIDSTSEDMVDASRPLDQIEAAAEGIFAKLRAAGAQPVLIHLHRREWTPRCEAVTALWEEVAERFGAPSVDVGAALRELLASGGSTEDRLFRDMVHTTDEGSQLIADMLDAALEELLAMPVQDPPPLPAPRHAVDYSSATVVPAELQDAQGRGEAGRFRLVLPYVQVGMGEPIRRTLPGDLVGLVVLVGTDSGGIRMTADGISEEAMLWNDTCWYTRLSTIVFEHRPPAGTEVSIELTDAPVDYASCRRPIPEPERIEKTLKVAGYMVLDPARSVVGSAA
jgi:hypothetical protein